MEFIWIYRILFLVSTANWYNKLILIISLSAWPFSWSLADQPIPSGQLISVYPLWSPIFRCWSMFIRWSPIFRCWCWSLFIRWSPIFRCWYLFIRSSPIFKCWSPFIRWSPIFRCWSLFIRWSPIFRCWSLFIRWSPIFRCWSLLRDSEAGNGGLCVQRGCRQSLHTTDITGM